MKIMIVVALLVMVGLTGCQKRDTDNSQQDKTTTPHSMDKD
ncbi:MAG: hypothetical protein RR633_07090 [Acinetobacter sp.]